MGSAVNLTPLERQLARACWKAWMELNTIRARDGVPYPQNGNPPGVTEEYFSSVVEECGAAVEAATGAPVPPWMPAALCESPDA